MTTSERQQVKEKIVEHLEIVEREISTLTELTRPIAPENAIGRVSRMDAINNKSINDAALRQAKDRHRRLLYALDKVEDAGFGQCSRCQQTIPLGRLLLMPHSLRCVRCADR